MLSHIEQIIAYTFKDPSLLQAALAHPAVQNPTGRNHFERLEFLGDRVLGLALAEALYHYYPDENEGALAIRIAYLGSAKTLKVIIHEAGLEEVLRSGFPVTTFSSIPLEDICEAILGAVYLDDTFKAASTIVQSLWKKFLRQPLTALKDAKSALQEFLQENGKRKPIYTKISRTGPDHNPMFCMQACSPCDNKIATGTGSSKQIAEQEAAAALLNIFQKEDELAKTV
ncbi:MAG: ribonuclease III [Holosporales bacterium]|nr:ribonuclease III [Holosporales bacterium]